MNMLTAIQIEEKLVDARNSDPQWRARRDKLELLMNIMLLTGPQHVDLGTYRAHSDECGTVACIAGWACMSQEFIRQGLRLEASLFGPVYNGLACNSALGQFFDIPHYVAECLFDSANFSALDRMLLGNLGIPFTRVLIDADEVFYEDLPQDVHHQLALARLRYTLDSDDRGELSYWDRTALFGKGVAKSPWAGLLFRETAAEVRRAMAIHGDA